MAEDNSRSPEAQVAAYGFRPALAVVATLFFVTLICPMLVALPGRGFSVAQGVLQAWLHQHVIVGLYLLAAVVCTQAAGLYMLIRQFMALPVERLLPLAAYVIPSVLVVVLLLSSLPTLEDVVPQFEHWIGGPAWWAVFSCVAVLASGIACVIANSLVLGWVCLGNLVARYRRGSW